MEKISEKIGVFAAVFTMLSLGTSPHPFVLVACYIIHELGHIIFAKLVGAKMRKIKVGPFHLSLSYDSSGISYKKEILVQFGGILFNFLFALLAAALPFFKGECISFFVLCNISLALMNMYPASILDGGGILKSILLMFMEEGKAGRIWHLVSFLSVTVMWLFAVYLQIIFQANISLFVVSIVLLVEMCFSHA